MLGTEDEYSNAPADASCTESPIRSPVLTGTYKTQQITFLEALDLKSKISGKTEISASLDSE